MDPFHAWKDTFNPCPIKTQRKARNAPGRWLWVPWAVSLWHKRAGVVTTQDQQIRAQYPAGSGPTRMLHSACSKVR